MRIPMRLKTIEKNMAARHLDSKIHLFDSHEECDQARKNNLIGENDICIIDDIPDYDD